MSSVPGLNARPRADTCSWNAWPPSMSTVRSTTGCHRRKLMALISLRKPSDSPRPSSSARAATSAWKNSSASTRASNKPADRRRTLTSQIEIKECRMLERWFQTPASAGKRFKWSSFSHQNQTQPTRIDRVQLEAVNRPVPCKHKGIRQFSENFGKSRVKAKTLQWVAVSNPVSLHAHTVFVAVNRPDVAQVGPRSGDGNAATARSVLCGSPYEFRAVLSAQGSIDKACDIVPLQEQVEQKHRDDRNDDAGLQGAVVDLAVLPTAEIHEHDRERV
jgi:hypothetical protein